MHDIEFSTVDVIFAAFLCCLLLLAVLGTVAFVGALMSVPMKCSIQEVK